ncbi:MAG: hypothetical protein ACTSWN_14570 [Promethearchaeota archaeon]
MVEMEELLSCLVYRCISAWLPGAGNGFFHIRWRVRYCYTIPFQSQGIDQ